MQYDIHGVISFAAIYPQWP